MHTKGRVCFMIIILCSFVWPQPEAYIERDDVPFLIGQWATFEQNTDLFQWEPFDSTRLWWDLTTYPGGSVARVHLLDPSQGVPPATDTFPLAKIVELDTMGTGDVVWSYLTDTTYFFYVMGIDMVQSGFRFIGNYQPDYRCYVYPIYYGHGWNTAWQWTYEVLPGMPYTATEQHEKTIVAKGKVKIPVSGDHFWPCLVIKDHMTYSDTWGTTDTRWIYEWIVPGRFAGGNGVAAAQSTNGAAQNFILVENFFKMTELFVPGWDLRCPDFANTTIWPDTNYAGPYIVSSEITDSTGIGTDSLFYNVNGGTFQGLFHDSIVGDTYFYTMPQVAQSCTLGYFLWATDSFSYANNVGIWNTDPICAPESTYHQFSVTTGIAEGFQNDYDKMLFTCTPNPFGDAAHLKIQIPRTKSRNSKGQNAEQMALKIYDITGRVVKQWDYEIMRRSDQITWTGYDDLGQSLPAGVYFVTLSYYYGTHVQAVTLIK